MLRDHGHCVDLDKSARPCRRDSKDSNGSAAIPPYRTGCGVGRHGIHSGGEIDRQFGDILGSSAGLGQHCEQVAQGLLRLRPESVEQGAGIVRSVLPADVQRRPSGKDHTLCEGGAVIQLWGVDRRGLSGHWCPFLQIPPEYPTGPRHFTTPGRVGILWPEVQITRGGGNGLPMVHPAGRAYRGRMTATFSSLVDAFKNVGVARAYGAAIQIGGEEVIPVALVSFGFGGGSEATDQGASGGGGGGLVLPLGVYRTCADTQCSGPTPSPFWSASSR